MNRTQVAAKPNGITIGVGLHSRAQVGDSQVPRQTKRHKRSAGIEEIVSSAAQTSSHCVAITTVSCLQLQAPRHSTPQSIRQAQLAGHLEMIQNRTQRKRRHSWHEAFDQENNQKPNNQRALEQTRKPAHKSISPESKYLHPNHRSPNGNSRQSAQLPTNAQANYRRNSEKANEAK